MAVLRGVVAGCALGVLIAGGCVVRQVMPRELTGTCAGACDHYVDCKGDRSAKDDRARCEADCPNVFEDARSLAAFESLSCAKTLEFVDGRSPRSATSR
jgi:hypothetical protein